jgi:hypothetical protein
VPNRAKLYITAIIALGISLLISITVFSWNSPDPYRWASYLVITILASTFKVRLPGLTGTISLSFLFVLIGLSDFSLSEKFSVAPDSIPKMCFLPSESTPTALMMWCSANRWPSM